MYRVRQNLCQFSEKILKNKNYNSYGSFYLQTLLSVFLDFRILQQLYKRLTACNFPPILHNFGT